MRGSYKYLKEKKKSTNGRLKKKVVATVTLEPTKVVV